MPTTNRSSLPGERRAAEDLRDKATEIKENLQDLGESARQTAQESLQAVRDTASDYIEQGRDMAMDVSRSIEGRIREQPVPAVLIAAGVGFLIGICLMRR